jgi:hypothetical protein
MSRYHLAALTLVGWALIVTEPTPHTIKTGFPTIEACEKAADTWQANYKRHLKQANQAKHPNRRRRLAQAIPPTKCVDETKGALPPS